jgi:hypothetical protein
VPTTTRGPLPPGVYWRRRLALISVALVLVLGVAKLLGATGGDGSAEKATQVGAPSSATATVTVGETAAPAAKGNGNGNGKKKRKNRASQNASTEPTETVLPPTPTPTPTTPPPLPDPSGPCADGDVFLTPSAEGAVGGSDVTIMLNFQSAASEACTFDLSSDSVRLKVSKGSDNVWLSRQCPDAVPEQEVVVRRTTVTSVPMVWKEAKRSDDECSSRTAWALPGTYALSASVLGGEPTVVDFDLTAPGAATVTETVPPAATPAA